MIDRTRFGSWGLELSDDELARAVAGALEQRRPRSRDADEPLPVRAWKTPKHDAAHYRDTARAGTRFQVAPSLLDVAELLARPASGAAAVFIESDAQTSVVWTYPLRIGFLPGYRESEARELAQLYWPEAYQQVELSATASECDILVLPANLRSSLAALLERKLTIHADCVLVLGTLDESGERALRLIDVLRDAADAGGVAVANQPRAKRVQWFHEFLRALAHDLPLDVALFAQNAASQHPPLLVASRKLISAAHISKRVRNVTEHVRAYESAGMEAEDTGRGSVALPVSLERVKSDFEGATARGFDSELHAASAVGRVFRRLPANVRVATAAPRAEVDQRRVVAATFSEDGAETTVLRNAQKYRAEIRIGHGRKGETVASELFPRHLLPESKTGHRLTIVFAELPQDEKDAFLQPQVRELTLPPDGDSRAVRFWFRTGDTAPRYDARVLVLYQNRVLQTLRYSAPLDGQSAIALDAELDVYRLDDLDTRTRFDAALVANKAGERMGVCLVVDGKAAYVAPAGLEQQVDKVSSILDEATKLRKLPKTLGDGKLVEVMLKLSHEGNHLWTSLGLEQAGAKLARARRVQVVAAKPGEYLPVEFLYARPVPLQLTMCNHAAAALGGTNGDKCSTLDPATELCPVEFWGLSRVIEHVAWSDAKKNAPTIRTRGLFESAVVGLSDRVPPADAKKLMKAVDTATGGKAHRATSWSDWTSKIAEHKPSLLVLLTHTTIFQITGGPALEMASDVLPIAAIEEKHLRVPGSKHEPLVLLLGCDVKRAPIVYQNAVERLKTKHAGVVLGTLSTVLGPHAAAFAIALVEALKEAEESPTPMKFGDVLLDIKRKRLSAGDPFALTLVAYGDSEIRI